MEEQNNSVTAKQRMEIIDKVLDEYESKLGLPEYDHTYKHANLASAYMQFSRDEMEACDAEDCDQIAIILSSFSLHLQRSRNREVARKSWAESVIKKSVVPRLEQYKRAAGSFKDQYDAAMFDDEFCKKVSAIRDFAQQRAERLEFISSGVKAVADSFTNLGRAKRSKNYGTTA